MATASSAADVVTVSPRRLAWQRRRRSLATNWHIFRHNKQATVGLMILLLAGLVAVISPFVVPESDLDPATATGTPNSPPSPGYPLGTDNFGRSVLDLLIAGTRVSLLVGITATIGAVFIGAVIGLVSGFYGGTKIDLVLNALTDWFLVIPWLVLAIAMASILGPTLWNIIAVIAVTSWATTARLVRAQTLSVRSLSYIERARVLGASDWTLMTRHILPNVWPVIFANTVLTVSIAILSETTLAILGLGSADAISWGRIIEEAFNAGAMTNGYWWWMIPPGIAIVLVCLAFSMCGHALDEILNPKLRRG
ncbi:MAG TPA: ABC transporter permease [Actinomycetes bacterium]|nr:ABC transporter permease [Actinomycetes bacterium]